MDAPVHVYTLMRTEPDNVLNAFIDPGVLTQFWLSAASGRLNTERAVEWHFMVPGVKSSARMLAHEPGKRLEIAFDGDETAEIAVAVHAGGGTRVDVRTRVVGDTHEALIATAVDTASGYMLVLSDLKLLLETGRAGTLVPDQAALIAESRNA